MHGAMRGSISGRVNAYSDWRVTYFGGVMFLINIFEQRDLPRPIYAVVTEHSIDWPFNELLEHLIEERNKMEKRGK
jgi:hypothetical protein